MPDFTTMSRDQLATFRKKALKGNEKATANNNYLTVKFRMERWPQPADWVSTTIATEWSQYHGPSGHTTDKCEKFAFVSSSTGAGEKKGEPEKKAVKPKSDARGMKEWRQKVRLSHSCVSFGSFLLTETQVKKDFIEMKQRQRMKRKETALEGTNGEAGPAAKKTRKD